MKRISASFISSTVLISTAASALPYAMYEKYKAKPDTDAGIIQKMHIQGMLAGLTAANAALQENNQAPLYCIPQTLILEDENLSRIIETRLKKDIASGANQAHILIEVELLLGLQDTFPCGASK